MDEEVHFAPVCADDEMTQIKEEKTPEFLFKNKLPIVNQAEEENRISEIFFRSKMPEMKERKLSVEPLFIINDSVAESEVLDVKSEITASLETDLTVLDDELMKEQSVEEALQNTEKTITSSNLEKKVRWEDLDQQENSDPNFIPPMKDTIFATQSENTIKKEESEVTPSITTSNRPRTQSSVENNNGESLGELLARIDKVVDKLNALELGKQVVINHNHYYVSPSK